MSKRPAPPTPSGLNDPEATVNLSGDILKDVPLRDDLAAQEAEEAARRSAKAAGVADAHLRGLVEALVFASDQPLKVAELAKCATSTAKEVRAALETLKDNYAQRGIQLEEIAGGWIFRTNPVYAPFVRDMARQKPVRLTRAQIETLAILAYRQPITRPEIDDIRGVDSGPVLKLLLERDLVKILGKKDEPGRPILYGTTSAFLELFGMKSIKDLPTLREFTELNEDSRRVVERELGDVLESRLPEENAAANADMVGDVNDEENIPTEVPPPASGMEHDTLPPTHPMEFADEQQPKKQ